MFDIGWSEILVIVIVTILVVGPKELPSLLRTVGKTIGNVRRMAGDFQNQFNEALREAELEDVKNTISDVRSLNPKTAVKDAVQKQLGFDDDFADDLTEQVSKSGREINDALSDAEVKVKQTDADKSAPAAKVETVAAAKAVTEAASEDVPAKPATKPKARAAAKPKTQTAAKPRPRAKKADTAKAAPATNADAETAAPVKKPRRAKPKPAAKAKSAAAPSQDKKTPPSADDPSQKA